MQQTRFWPALAIVLGVAALAPALVGCAATDPLWGRSLPVPYPGDNRRPDYDDRYGYAARVDRDADAYVDDLDRQLGLSGMQEMAARRIVRDRARDLLRRTSAYEHHRIYPFPRGANWDASEVRRFWEDTDRQIERVLNARQRDEYRRRYADRYDDGYYRNGDYRRDRRRDDGYRRSDGRRPGTRVVRPRVEDRRGRDDDRRSRERAPAFCRSGQGHPVFGMDWCYDRGYYPDRDVRRSSDDEDDDRWDDRRRRRGDDDDDEDDDD